MVDWRRNAEAYRSIKHDGTEAKATRVYQTLYSSTAAVAVNESPKHRSQPPAGTSPERHAEEILDAEVDLSGQRLPLSGIIWSNDLMHVAVCRWQTCIPSQNVFNAGQYCLMGQCAPSHFYIAATD